MLPYPNSPQTSLDQFSKALSAYSPNIYTVLTIHDKNVKAIIEEWIVNTATCERSDITTRQLLNRFKLIFDFFSNLHTGKKVH